MIYTTIEEPFTNLVDPSALESAGRLALECAEAPADSVLTVVISDDEQLAELNSQYLGIDAPTDVLSFPVNEVDPDTGARYLGDVLISYPRAQAQAEAGGHAVLDELQLLVVHGVLHLLGYDHAAEMDKERMWAVQADALKRLGCSVSGYEHPE